MSKDEQKISCSVFEENLSDYLDKELDGDSRKAMAAHSLKCPICHSLLNEVREAIGLCREISEPVKGLTGLEAKILSKTMPQTAMRCEDFETHLTDYLDGFLPAAIFHRWERHAVVCEQCTDLPGEVVRSIAACVTYKLDELPIPDGLNERILQATIGTAVAAEVRPSRLARLREWAREISVPISVPQLAPVAMMLVFAFLFFSQTRGSIGGMYEKSLEMAGRTYEQGANMVLGQQK